MHPTSLIQSFRAAGHSSLIRTSLARNAAVLPVLLRQSRSTNTTAPASKIPEHQQILNAQRAVRPISPHFTIYQPQITWYMSFVHRLTGSGLAVVLYGSAIAYAVGPFVGASLDSDTLVATVATLPVGVKVVGKIGLAFPFTYHALNGIRHLIWDTGRTLTNKGVNTTGLAVLGLSTISAIGLAAF